MAEQKTGARSTSFDQHLGFPYTSYVRQRWRQEKEEIQVSISIYTLGSQLSLRVQFPIHSLSLSVPTHTTKEVGDSMLLTSSTPLQRQTKQRNKTKTFREAQVSTICITPSGRNNSPLRLQFTHSAFNNTPLSRYRSLFTNPHCLKERNNTHKGSIVFVASQEHSPKCWIEKVWATCRVLASLFVVCGWSLSLEPIRIR